MDPSTMLTKRVVFVTTEESFTTIFHLRDSSHNPYYSDSLTVHMKCLNLQTNASTVYSMKGSNLLWVNGSYHVIAIIHEVGVYELRYDIETILVCPFALSHSQFLSPYIVHVFSGVPSSYTSSVYGSLLSPPLITGQSYSVHFVLRDRYNNLFNHRFASSSG